MHDLVECRHFHHASYCRLVYVGFRTAKSDVLLQGPFRNERLLRHVAKQSWRHDVHLVPIQIDLPGAWPQKTKDDIRRSRLSSSRRTDEGYQLSLAYLEINAADRVAVGAG